VSGINVELPVEAVERIAARAAELVLAQLPTVSAAPFMSVAEAAGYLRCSRQRIYDLCSAGRLPRHKDGERLLLRRDDLDAYLREGGRA
jgi:excisionase family DNA binding protein